MSNACKGMATAWVSVVIASWLSAAVHAQTPPPEAIARCRAMDLTAQWGCFKALNEKMQQATKSDSTAPATAPVAPPPNPLPSMPSSNATASSAPIGTAAAKAVPSCASLLNPQQRLSCYDAKFPPPNLPIGPAINN